MSKRRVGAVFVFFGAVLLAAALLLFLHNEREDTMAGEAAEEALSALQEAIRKPAKEESNPNAVHPDPTETTEVTEPAELTVVPIDGYDYIGYISIPSFELELPIIADWSMEKLQTAPCLQYGSPLTDDAVIAGHNFKQHFRALHDIQVGERVTFTDMNGYVIEYSVADVEIIDPRNVYDVINSEYDLILYTCTTGGQSRVTVRCNRTEGAA
ncbi:MAG: sortase [Faecousia sp.]